MEKGEGERKERGSEGRQRENRAEMEDDGG